MEEHEYSKDLIKLMDDAIRMPLRVTMRRLKALSKEELGVFEEFRKKHDDARREGFRKLIKKRVE